MLHGIPRTAVAVLPLRSRAAAKAPLILSLHITMASCRTRNAIRVFVRCGAGSRQPTYHPPRPCTFDVFWRMWELRGDGGRNQYSWRRCNVEIDQGLLAGGASLRLVFILPVTPAPAVSLDRRRSVGAISIVVFTALRSGAKAAGEQVIMYRFGIDNNVIGIK